MALKPITLVGEQKRVLFLPHTNPIQIKGSAGSGKTTVALYRAKHLVETYVNLFTEPEVAVFTYNQSLMKYIGKLLLTVTGGYKKDSDKIGKTTPGLNVQVTTIHKWTRDYLKEKGFWENHQIAKGEDQESAIIHAKSLMKYRHPDQNILRKNVTFFRDEFSWIKGKMFKSEAEYQEAARSGMGTKDRVTKTDKTYIWKAFEEYQRTLDKEQQIDFDDFALVALDLISRDRSFIPPFTHIVVDEAQDLNKAQITLLKRLVRSETNSITIIADAAQRIYKSGFTWSEVGINIRGTRTIEFKKNYRNTSEIASAAISLLTKDNDRAEFTATEATSIRSHGDKPYVALLNGRDTGLKYLHDRVKGIDLKKESVIVLHRFRRSLTGIAHYLKKNSVASEVISQDFTDFASDTVKVCTLSSIKGLEFDHVFITDLNDDIIPYPYGFTDPDDPLHISTERRLLYTAMTRARKSLHLIATGTPCRFLKEIDPNSLRQA